jgi:uncharacterized membrane protein
MDRPQCETYRPVSVSDGHQLWWRSSHPETRSLLDMLAAYDGTGYKIVLLLHILTVLVAFAPAFVNPLLLSQTKTLDATNRGKLLVIMAGNGRRIYAPALILAGLFGFALQGMSDGVLEFSQTWLWLAVIVWLAMNGILHAVLLPAERAVAGGDESATKKLDRAGIAMTLLVIVMLYLMILKPGASGL